jgi:nucleotide-binding universal stress UspA family protein
MRPSQDRHGPPRTEGGPIVVDVDDAESGKDAINWARREAERHGVPMRVLAGLEPERFLAASRGALMVVVGSESSLRMRDLADGSRAMSVAVHANVPVVVVRPGPPAAREGPSAGRVVTGADGTGLSAAAVDFAFAEARVHGCGVTLVHAVENEEARPAAEAMLAALSAGHPGVRNVVSTGLASHVLIAESPGARLLAVGSRGHGGLGGMLLGSVSQAVVHRAHCPVAVVRA